MCIDAKPVNITCYVGNPLCVHDIIIINDKNCKLTGEPEKNQNENMNLNYSEYLLHTMTNIINKTSCRIRA